MLRILRKIFGKKKIVPIRKAKIVFIEENENFIDHPLLKSILIYNRDVLEDEIPYSNVVLEELKREGVPVLDETLEIKRWLPNTSLELGRVDLV